MELGIKNQNFSGADWVRLRERLFTVPRKTEVRLLLPPHNTMKMYSSDPECGVCGSTDVVYDECRVVQESLGFWRCRQCGELTPCFDDTYMQLLEDEGQTLYDKAKRMKESNGIAPDGT